MLPYIPPNYHNLNPIRLSAFTFPRYHTGVPKEKDKGNRTSGRCPGQKGRFSAMKKFAAILLSLVLTLTVALADSIYVVSREDGSGTRAAFIELTGVEQKDADGNKVDMTTVEAAVYSGTSEVKTTVSQDVAAIGYISLGSMYASVMALKVARNPEDGAGAVYVEATP